MQIFADPRGAWFFGRVRGELFVGMVTATVYGSVHTGFLVSVMSRYLFLGALLVEFM